MENNVSEGSTCKKKQSSQDHLVTISNSKCRSLWNCEIHFATGCWLNLQKGKKKKKKRKRGESVVGSALCQQLTEHPFGGKAHIEQNCLLGNIQCTKIWQAFVHTYSMSFCLEPCVHDSPSSGFGQSLGLTKTFTFTDSLGASNRNISTSQLQSVVMQIKHVKRLTFLWSVISRRHLAFSPQEQKNKKIE